MLQLEKVDFVYVCFRMVMEIESYFGLKLPTNDLILDIIGTVENIPFFSKTIGRIKPQIFLVYKVLPLCL